MDIWFAAAAAGAGYLAKYWQNAAKDKETLSESDVGKSSREKTEATDLLGKKQIGQKSLGHGRLDGRDQSYIFQRRGIRKLGDESYSNVGGTTHVDGLVSSSDEIASTSGVDGRVWPNSEESKQSNWISLLSSPAAFAREEHHHEDEDGYKCNGADLSAYSSNESSNALHPEFSHRKYSSGFESARVRSARRGKWYHPYSSVRPLNSLESCLLAQIYRDHGDMEEYVFSQRYVPPSTPERRPFFVTDGTHIISKARDNASSIWFDSLEQRLHTGDDVKSREKQAESGICSLSEAGLIKLPRKLKKHKQQVRDGRSNISEMHHICEKIPSQGSPDGMLLFYLGIAIGVMCTTLSNKREVDSLNDLLRQTQNLVQDLHEELEMKDSLTVKELANEAVGLLENGGITADTKKSISSLPYQAQTAFSLNGKSDESVRCGNSEEHVHEWEHSESRSKIEAELEAELERLEMNINASNMGGRLSDLGEIDPDFVADVVHGELRADGINHETDYKDQDTNSSSTTHTMPANYSVSPKELSLRLHEVIQSRLEERILELESALKDSQKQLRFVEVEWMNSQRGHSNSDAGSRSTQETPTMIEHGEAMAHPLFLNLSGDALNAYNEAYAEFIKITEANEERPPSIINGGGQIDIGTCKLDQVSGGLNGSLPHLETNQLELYDIGESEDDDDDEMGKLLIKQIVEKSRHGSPVVLNVQRMLFSMDE